MSYRETARRFALAESSARYGAASDPATLAAVKLPMSEWAEVRREGMTPQTIAHNHALHVEGVADDLRTMLAAPAPEPDRLTITPAELERYRWIERHARRLLAAIGEGE